MARAILQRLLRGGAERQPPPKSFHLPGALHEQVRVLLLDSGDLVDLLLAMPFAEQLKQAYPGARLGLLSGERCAEVALSSGRFDDLLVVDDAFLEGEDDDDREAMGLFAGEEWELAILTGRLPDPARERLARLSGAQLRLGPGHEKAWPDINCELRAGGGGMYPAGRTATWSRLLGLPLREDRPRWPLSEKRRRQVAQLVHFNKPSRDQLLVGVDCGVGKEGERLSLANLAYVVNHLANHIRCKLILLGLDDDEESRAGLAGQLRGERLDLPRESHEDRLLLAGQCDLLLAGNTDLFHFSTAMDVPTLGLFTPADAGRWTPRGAPRSEVLVSTPGEALPLGELMAKAERLLAG